MDLFEAIAARHSYRGSFTDAPVPRDDLRKIVQAGVQAPSGKNEQTTSFAIVDDPQLLQEIAALFDRPVCTDRPGDDRLRDRFACGGRAVVVCRRGLRRGGGEHAAAIAALGYATVWLDGVLRRRAGIAERIGVVRVNIPRGPRGFACCCPLACPVEPGRQMEKLSLSERAWFNRRG